MRKFLIPSALVIAVAAGAGVAMADSSTDKVAAGAVSMSQVTSRLQSQGFTVSKIKLDDGRYKVKGTDAAGHKQKLKINPATGETLGSEADDD